MKKIFILLVLSLMLSATPVFAVGASPRFGCWGWSYGCMMWSEQGTFLNRAEFEARIDDLINRGLLAYTQRQFMLDRYEFRLAYGWFGYCRFGGGRGGGFRGGRRGGW